MELSRLEVGSLQSNCYLLQDRAGDDAALVDPGAEPQKILAWVEDAPVNKILITHGHGDHVGALHEIRQALNAPVYGHALDAERFGLEFDVIVASGRRIEIGSFELEVHEIPGHTPGSIAFAVREDPFERALVGDAIFPGGPGHTQSHRALLQLMEALQKTVFAWPDGVVLFPGHGSTTTVGAERAAFERLRMKGLPENMSGDVTWR